jgi:DNA-binding PadR family transcriptional regulator
MPAERPRLDLSGALPLKATEVLILTMLTAGDRHGYGIRQDILEHTGGSLELEAGNLYRHIRRLERDGLIEESGRRPARESNDERRIYYRLTAHGRRALVAEMLRLRALVQFAEQRRIIAPARA